MKFSEYLARVAKLLAEEGEAYHLRIEARQVWEPTGDYRGSIALVDRAKGELADLTRVIGTDDEIAIVKPRKQIPYGVANILTEALNGSD